MLTENLARKSFWYVPVDFERNQWSGLAFLYAVVDPNDMFIFRWFLGECSSPLSRIGRFDKCRPDQD